MAAVMAVPAFAQGKEAQLPQPIGGVDGWIRDRAGGGTGSPGQGKVAAAACEALDAIAARAGIQLAMLLGWLLSNRWYCSRS